MSSTHSHHQTHIECPKCHTQIALTEALGRQIEGDLRGRIEAELYAGIEEREAQARELELGLRRKLREVESAQKGAELELERRLEDRLKQAEEENARRFAETHSRALAEKETQLATMRKQLIEMERRITQNSQQLQGEVAQQSLYDRLSQQFPSDDLEMVGKGARGADILQRVSTGHNRTRTGSMILWENKEAKSFSSDWIDKLKKDQSECKADIAVLVTPVFPKKENRHFYHEDGVWVVTPVAAADLAVALRTGLIEAFNAKRLVEQEAGSKEDVYRYFTGNAFRRRVVTIVSAITTLKESLASERKAIERIWALRETQLNGLMSGTVGIVGDIQGIAGTQLVSIPELELESDTGK